MMRVLVTGGFGYVGGRLVQALAATGIRVTAVSRNTRPAPDGVTVATVDWRDAGALSALCTGHDAVVHLAAMNEPDGERDPEGALLDNGLATLRLVEAAVAAGVGRFVYASTAKVFGANPAGVIDETCVPRPASHYAITHRLAEDYVLAKHDKGAFAGAVARLSNVVGAPADADVNAWMLIANDFCRQAADKGEIRLSGSGMAWRDFAPMSDVVAALCHLAGLPRQHLGDGLFHLGAGRSLRIRDLAATVAGRATALMRRPVPVIAPDPVQGGDAPLLEWRVDKLAATGWTAHPGALEAEIDATLGLCLSTARGGR